MDTFKALVLNQTSNHLTIDFQEIDKKTVDGSHFPKDADIEIEVHYSSLNYKDGLIVTENRGGLVRSFPHIPGIDLAGRVLSSTHNDFPIGTEVIRTGWRYGESYWGGYSQYTRARASDLIKIPSGLTPRSAMMVGTAGLTALLAIEQIKPKLSDAPLLVTGASGGVGSWAIYFLHALGYRVQAATRRPNELSEYLTQLGAMDCIDAAELPTAQHRPLNTSRWSGVINTVAGGALRAILSQLQYQAKIACCGLVAGNDFSASIIPFLLRANSLIGIDSVMIDKNQREHAWQKIGKILNNDNTIESLLAIKEIGLQDVKSSSSKMMKGEINGRYLISLR